MNGTGAAKLWRQRLPLAAGAQQIKNAAGNGAEICAGSPNLRGSRILRQQGFKLPPKLFGHPSKFALPIAVHVHLRASKDEIRTETIPHLFLRTEITPVHVFWDRSLSISSISGAAGVKVNNYRWSCTIGLEN